MPTTHEITDPSSPVLVAVTGTVATVTMNRPERLNAANAALRELLIESLESLDADPDIHAIVLTGAGRGFCAGSDLGGLQERAAADEAPPRAKDYPMYLDTPVIAAVNGAVAGMGFGWAVLADIRFAAAGAKWLLPFARLGLVAELGLAWSLPRLVGQGGALEILLSGGAFISEDLHRMGLVQRVCAPEAVLAEAQAYAAVVAANSPGAIRIIRRQIRESWTQSPEVGFTDSIDRQHVALDGADFKEAMAARRDGRDPDFPSAHA